MVSQARTVKRIVEPTVVVEGAGVRLKRTIGSRELDYLDPSLMLAHTGSDHPADYQAGFHMHPHRAIETVTYVLAGAVRHRDHLGNVGVISAGGVEWMTAGRGILHEEMPQAVDGKMAGFQLWVNLPARHKMTQPRYQEIAAAHIPELAHGDGVCIHVIAGAVDSASGPVTQIAADPTYLDVWVPAGGQFSQPLPRGQTAFAYVFEGAGELGLSDAGAGRTLSAPALAILGEGDFVRVQAGDQPVRFLLVAGKALGEPIARYGPFVMNTREEIEQALRDLRNGTFVTQP